MEKLYFWYPEVNNACFFNFLAMRDIEVSVIIKCDVVIITITNEDQKNWLRTGTKHFFGSAEPTPFFVEE